MQKIKVTHLSLEEEIRRAAGIRAAQLGLSLTTYIGQLIRADAQDAGIVELIRQSGKGASHG